LACLMFNQITKELKEMRRRNTKKMTRSRFSSSLHALPQLAFSRIE
jgi:hypothetical protein